jgi:hypothetical protein
VPTQPSGVCATNDGPQIRQNNQHPGYDRV